MATFIVVCGRFDGNCIKKNIQATDLSSMRISEFRHLASKELNVSFDVELVHCGTCLRDDKYVGDYDIQLGSIIHVLRKSLLVIQEAEPLDKATLDQVTTAMQPILLNPSKRSALEKKLEDPQTIENLISAVPSLGKDPVAVAILQDVNMLSLATLDELDTVHNMIMAHPAMGHALMLLIGAVNEEAAKTPGTSSATHDARAMYALDQMSDDDDDDEEMQPSRASNSGIQRRAAPSLQSGIITADFFRQAMMEVTGDSSPSRPAPRQSVVTEAQLQQLREMGIMDEEVARRALEETGGNIQAALELIFGDGF